MDLSVREVARLLDVTEDTLYRWIRRGEIPAHRTYDQHWFNRVELQEWAAANEKRLSPDLFAPVGAGGVLPSLRAAVERGGVFDDVPGDRRDAVLEAVSQLPGIPNNIVRSLLLEVLIGREALASTAVGDGVALPHPRDPLVVPVEAPTVLICFPARPIDFGALDGKPIHTVFLLLSPTVRAHLQMLVRVAYALRDAKLTEMLPRHAPRDAILERLGRLERESAENRRGTKA